MPKPNYLLYALFTIALSLQFSCSHEKAYTQELVMADSAYMKGSYELADALLDASRKTINWDNKGAAGNQDGLADHVGIVEKIIDDMEGFGGHGSMAGFGYYQTIKRNRAERKRLHAEERAAIK